MKVSFEQDILTYCEKVEALLLAQEACNNLMLGLLDRALAGKSSAPTTHLGLVEEDGVVLYAFMQTPPNNWILADISGVKQEILAAIATFIWKHNLEVPGVLGPVPYAEAFTKAYDKVAGKKATLHMEQLIYQLDQVNPVPISQGSLVVATEKYEQLAADWLFQFGVEANETLTLSRAKDMARQMIENQSLYLWCVEDVPVSMVNQSRKTKHGTTVNAVFTPDEHKRKGYATSAVARLSQKLLDEGFQFCSLYTDLANPTSNGIYRKIGYYKVGSSIVYTY